MNQEQICFVIVAFASFHIGVRFFRAMLAAPVAQLFLNKGQVKWAMRVRNLSYSQSPRIRHE